MRRVLVTGGRGYDDSAHVRHVLSQVLRPGDTLVHGAARGADSLAAEAAESLGFDVEAHPANWKQYGKAAGAIRNCEMLDTGIDLVIAFPGGRGTAHMTDIARTAGITLIRA